MTVTITVTPNPAHRGELVDVFIKGLPRARFNGHSDTATVATKRAQRDGSFDFAVEVGSGSSLGTHKVSVWDSANRTKIAEAPYTVAATPPPPPPPPPPVSTVPSAPLSLNGAVGDTVVNLAWAAPASNGGAPVTGYRVYLNGGLAASPIGLTQTFTGLLNGVAASFAVAAVNAVGEGPKTSPILLTPVAPVIPPTGPTVPAGLAEGTITLQQAINGATGGFGVPPRTFRETIDVNKPLIIEGVAPGAIIDGRDPSGAVVRENWAKVSADGVTLRKLSMLYAKGTYGTGSFETRPGIGNLLVDDCQFGYSYVNVNLTDAHDSELRNVHSHHAGELCLRVAAANPHGGKRNRIVGGSYHDGDMIGTGVDGDAGSIKVTYQDDFIWDGGEVFDSSKGLWFDGSCLNSIVRNGRFHDNRGPGVMDETSTGTKILDSYAWRNGFGAAVWGWGAGFLVATSRAAEIARCISAWNYAGITVIGQVRSDNPGVRDNFVHDNIVVAEQPSAGNDRFGLMWGEDSATSMYVPASNNRGLNNRFYYPAGENQFSRFIWVGYRNLASFVTVPGGTGSAWIPQADAMAELQAHQIPTVPR